MDDSIVTKHKKKKKKKSSHVCLCSMKNVQTRLSPVWLLLPEPFRYRSSKQKCPQSRSIFLCVSQRRSLPLFNCLPRFCLEQPAALKCPSWYDVLRCPFRQCSPGEWSCLLAHHRWLLSPAHSSGSLENSRAAPLNSCYILGLIPSPFPWCGCAGAGGGMGSRGTVEEDWLCSSASAPSCPRTQPQFWTTHTFLEQHPVALKSPHLGLCCRDKPSVLDVSPCLLFFTLLHHLHRFTQSFHVYVGWGCSLITTLFYLKP